MMETALELCRRGLACAFLPKFVVRLHNQNIRAALQLVEQTLPSAKIRIHQPVYLVKRKSFAENRELRLLARGLRTLCRS
jgi:DNA-binding transcriptional LysR family regulator